MKRGLNFKRTYQATLPDGSIVTRNTKTRNYRFVIAVHVSSEGRCGVWGWSQSSKGAAAKARDGQKRSGYETSIVPCSLVKGAEYEWRDALVDGRHCVVTASVDPKQPVGMIVNVMCERAKEGS